MLPKDLTFSPETIDRARALYADPAVPVARILNETGMRGDTLYHYVDGADGRYPALARRRNTQTRKPAGNRAALIARLWRTAQRQVRDIEKRLSVDPQPEQRERDARMLAVLVKTLRELSHLDASCGAAKTDAADENDDIPRDIDEFRRELARRMDAFVDSRTGAGVSRDAKPA